MLGSLRTHPPALHSIHDTILYTEDGLIERINADYTKTDDIEVDPGKDNQSTERTIAEVGKQYFALECISLTLSEIKRQKARRQGRSHKGTVYLIGPEFGFDVIPYKLVTCTDTRLDGIRNGEDEELGVYGVCKQSVLSCSLGGWGYQGRDLHG